MYAAGGLLEDAVSAPQDWLSLNCCIFAAGVVAALQANDLPNPVVEIGVAGSQKYAVAAARTLQVIAQLTGPPRLRAARHSPIITREEQRRDHPRRSSTSTGIPIAQELTC